MLAIFLLLWKNFATPSISFCSCVSLLEKNRVQVQTKTISISQSRYRGISKYCQSFKYSVSSRNSCCRFPKRNSCSRGKMYILMLSLNFLLTNLLNCFKIHGHDSVDMEPYTFLFLFAHIVFGLAKKEKKENLDAQAKRDADAASKKAEEQGTAQYKDWYVFVVLRKPLPSNEEI